MKRNKIKEDYHKIKCEEWFNDKNLILYGLFATDREYIPITLEDIYTKIKLIITNIDNWEELYERKEEILDTFNTCTYEVKPIQELKNKRFTKNQKQIAGKINELIRIINKSNKK